MDTVMRKRVRSTALGVVESRVAKHTSEDTHDSGVEFITPAGYKGNQFPTRNPDVSETQFYTPHYVTDYMLATSSLYITEFYIM